MALGGQASGQVMPNTLMMTFFMSASAAGGSWLTLGSFAQPVIDPIVTSPTPVPSSSIVASAQRKCGHVDFGFAMGWRIARLWRIGRGAYILLQVKTKESLLYPQQSSCDSNKLDATIGACRRSGRVHRAMLRETRFAFNELFPGCQATAVADQLANAG